MKKTTAIWVDPPSLSQVRLEKGGPILTTYYNKDGIMCVKDPVTGEEIGLIWHRGSLALGQT